MALVLHDSRALIQFGCVRTDQPRGFWFYSGWADGWRWHRATR